MMVPFWTNLKSKSFPTSGTRGFGTQDVREDSKTEGLCQFESFRSSMIAPSSLWAA